MARNSARGSFRGSFRCNDSSSGRGNTSNRGQGNPSNGGRVSPFNGGQVSPSNGGKGIRRNGVAGSSSASIDVDPLQDSRSPNETNDMTDISEDAEIDSSHVARGPNTMGQVPTHPSNRILVELLGMDFADVKVSREIVAIFKNMFRGPWTNWTSVPKIHRNKVWEHF